MTKIQWRRDTAAAWTAANPILNEGEAGFETNTGKVKIGNGTSTWTALPYMGALWSDMSGKPLGADVPDAEKNVLSATKLTTARTINGVSFDGTSNITVEAGITRVVESVTSGTVFASTPNKDYVYITDGDPTRAYIMDNGTDPHAASVVTFLRGEGATEVFDSSPLGVTFTGGGIWSTEYVKYGTRGIGAKFFAQNNYTAFAFPGDFTIEMWNYGSGNGNLFTTYSANNTTGGISFGITSNAYLYFQTNNVTRMTGTTRPLTALWNHLALTRSGSTVRMFVNGVVAGTFTDSTAYTNNNTGLPQIGDSGTGLYTPYMDDVRITKGVARYTSNFNPDLITPLTHTLPSPVNNTNHYSIDNVHSLPIQVTSTSSTVKVDQVDPSISSLLSFDGANNSTKIVDESPNRILWSAVGSAKISTAQSKFGGSSLLIGAVANSFIFPTSTSSAPVFTFGTGDFTIELWAYWQNLTGIQCLIDWRSAQGVRPAILSSGTNLNYYVDSLDRISATSALAGLANTWVHIVLNKTAGVTFLFVNGVMVGQVGDTFDYGVGANKPNIGRAFDGNSFSGYIDDLRITKGKALYGNLNFTPPTAPHGSVAAIPGGQTARYISDGSRWRTL